MQDEPISSGDGPLAAERLHASGSRRSRREGGQALVEFILIVPLMIALLAGSFEAVWYTTSRNVVAQAAQAGARVAAREGAITPDVSAAVDSEITGGRDVKADIGSITASIKGRGSETVTGGNGTFSSQPICAVSSAETPGSQTVTVTVSYNYHLVFPFLDSPLFLGLGHTIFRSPVVMSSSLPAETAWITGIDGPTLDSGTPTTC